MIPIWDLWIRLFHWSLAFVVAFLLISGETGVGFFDWHRLAGEVVLALIIFRLVWGIAGSSNARISTLFVNPRQAIDHLRKLRTPSQDRGHNAAGGWAVLVMILLLLIQAVTGMFIADDEAWVEGAFYGVLSEDISNIIYNVHHTNAGILQIIVLLHIGMIAVYFFIGKQNLLKPMITGFMNWRETSPPPAVQFGKFLTGLVIAVGSFLAVAAVAGWLRQ